MTYKLPFAPLPPFLALSFYGVYLGNAMGVFLMTLGSLILISPQLWGREAFARFLNETKLEIKSSALWWLAMGFCSSFFISSLLALDPSKSFSTLGAFLGIGLSGYLWFYILRNQPESALLDIPRTLFISGVVLAGIILAEIFVWKMAGIDFHHGKILTSSRRFAAIFVVLLPFLLSYSFAEEKRKIWIGLFVVLLVVFASGGRTAILFCLIVYALYGFFVAPWQSLRKWKETFSSFFLTLFASAACGVTFHYFLAGAAKFTNRISGPDAVTGSGRTGIWEFTIDRFFDSPFFGVGLHNFRLLDFSSVTVTSKSHPHNMILELLLETGIVGTGAVVAFSSVILFLTLRALKNSTLYNKSGLRTVISAALLSLVSYGLVAQLLTSVFHGWWLVYPMLLLAILGAAVFHLKTENEKLSNEFGPEKTKKYDCAVSVIMPCHNGAPYVRQAIESVLSQTYPNLELLIMDDGSSDDSYAIMQDMAQNDPRIRIFKHETAMGEGAARNDLILAAKGRYIAFLDCDDLWHPDKLEIQIAAMEKNRYPISYGCYDLINEDGAKIGFQRPDRASIRLHHMFYTNDIGCPTAVYDSAYFGVKQMKNLKRNTDMLFWIDLLKTAPAAFRINHILSSYRVHKKGVSYNKIGMAKAHWSTFRNDLDVPFLMAVYYFARYSLRGFIKTLRTRRRPA